MTPPESVCVPQRRHCVLTRASSTPPRANTCPVCGSVRIPPKPEFSIRDKNLVDVDMVQAEHTPRVSVCDVSRFIKAHKNINVLEKALWRDFGCDLGTRCSSREVHVCERVGFFFYLCVCVSTLSFHLI